MSKGNDPDFHVRFPVYHRVRKTTQWQTPRPTFDWHARNRDTETRMALDQLQDAFNLNEEFLAESGLFVFVPRNNRPEFIAQLRPRHGQVCSLAQDFSFDLAPHVLPVGRAGCACIERRTPALDFSGPGCFHLGCFTLGNYV